MEKKMSVIGAGTMGWGIVQVFASAGYEVILCDRDITLAEKGVAAISATLDKLVGREKIQRSEAERILQNVIPCEINKIPECSLVVEAIFEDINVKKELFQTLETLLPATTIFATNTSSLSITELAGCLKNPSRFVGMHFFNPATLMKLVEVIGGVHTDESVITKTIAISEEIGKTPVKVNESAGFVVNRLLIPMINEAIALLAEGVSSAEDIDTAMKLGANHPLGPLALGDLVGLDVCLAIMEVLQNETGDDKYRAHPLLKKMVRAGKLGRKVKEGFYRY